VGIPGAEGGGRGTGRWGEEQPLFLPLAPLWRPQRRSRPIGGGSRFPLLFVFKFLRDFFGAPYLLGTGLGGGKGACSRRETDFVCFAMIYLGRMRATNKKKADGELIQQ